MTKSTIVDAAAFDSLREKLTFPAWVEYPEKYPCVFVWTWGGFGDFECQYIYQEDLTGHELRGGRLLKIIDIVSKVYGHNAQDITGPSQHRIFSDARCIICHEARLRAYTSKEIGQVLNRTHKSVYNMEAKYHNLRKHDADFVVYAKAAEDQIRLAGL